MLIDGVVASELVNGRLPALGAGDVIVDESDNYIVTRSGFRIKYTPVSPFFIYIPSTGEVGEFNLTNGLFTILTSPTIPNPNEPIIDTYDPGIVIADDLHNAITYNPNNNTFYCLKPPFLGSSLTEVISIDGNTGERSLLASDLFPDSIQLTSYQIIKYDNVNNRLLLFGNASGIFTIDINDGTKVNNNIGIGSVESAAVSQSSGRIFVGLREFNVGLVYEINPLNFSSLGVFTPNLNFGRTRALAINEFNDTLLICKEGNGVEEQAGINVYDLSGNFVNNVDFSIANQVINLIPRSENIIGVITPDSYYELDLNTENLGPPMTFPLLAYGSAQK